MDQIFISINEPSPVMLSQINYSKILKLWCPNNVRQVKAKWYGVITRKLTIFPDLKGKFWCSPNATDQPESIAERGYIRPGTFGPPAVVLTKKLKRKKNQTSAMDIPF